MSLLKKLNAGSSGKQPTTHLGGRGPRGPELGRRLGVAPEEAEQRLEPPQPPKQKKRLVDLL